MLVSTREEIMSGGYVIARENFKEAGKHVSAETSRVMFNLLYGLQSLTNQIEADFAVLRAVLTGLPAPAPKKGRQQKLQAKKSKKAKKAPAKSARAKAARRSR
jgi:hypothetical protein